MMIKAMLAFGAVTLVVAAPAAAQMAAGSLPKCSATVKDSCDQSMTTEKNAMTAEQAMKSGGVGDRKTSAAMPMAKPMMHKKHHKMMKTTTETTTTDKPM